ncbi:MAG: LysR family transcriptional regulator [Eggerthellaceae bacterium]|nr:LysR family transcriptional regulator [Eggerthellaceae bacterium]
MQFDYMDEFIVFAHHLNMTNAAAELHMAQSTLSKHIKQLELETGCPLVQYRNGKTYLTKAGAHFLNCATTILNTYHQLLRECQSVDAAGILPEITVQTPSLTDRSSEAYYRLIRRLRKEHPDLQVRYLRATYKTVNEGLKQGRVDLLIDYRYGSVPALLDAYAERSMAALHLSTDRLVVWCRHDHRLNRPELHVSDLRDVPIMVPSEILSTTRSATTALCKAHGFDPLFIPVEAASQQEFLEAGLPGSVYVYPASFMESPLIKANESMVAVPLADSDALIHGFAVTLRSPRAGIADITTWMTSLDILPIETE